MDNGGANADDGYSFYEDDSGSINCSEVRGYTVAAQKAGKKVCSVTPIRRAASATVLPSAISTSTSLSLLNTCYGASLFFAISAPFYGP